MCFENIFSLRRNNIAKYRLVFIAALGVITRLSPFILLPVAYMIHTQMCMHVGCFWWWFCSRLSLSLSLLVLLTSLPLWRKKKKKKTTFVLSAARAPVSSHEAMSVVALLTKEQKKKKLCTTMPNVFCSFFLSVYDHFLNKIIRKQTYTKITVCLILKHVSVFVCSFVYCCHICLLAVWRCHKKSFVACICFRSTAKLYLSTDTLVSLF